MSVNSERRRWGILPSASENYRMGESLRSKPLVIPLLAFACLLSVGLMSDILSDGTTEFHGLHESSSSPRMLSEKNDAGVVADDSKIDTDGPTFVFIMGLEGTGHHFYNDLLSLSPNMKKMQELEMCHPRIYSCKDSACKTPDKEGDTENEFFQLAHQFMSTHDGIFDANKRTKHFIDVGKRYDTAVEMLTTIGNKVNSWRREHNNEQVGDDASEFHVAINANSCRTSTQMSYPSFIGPDRPLQNFNLNVFYNACADAKVKCKHAYIYRDPYDVLMSTTRKRHYNSNMYDGIRLYTSVLQQIHSQMVSYPERNLGCFGFLDAKGYNIQQDWERFRNLWGWADDSSSTYEDFMAMAKEINTKEPTPMDDTMKARLVPGRLSVMMRAFEDIHNRVNEFCYSSLPTMDGGVNPGELSSEEGILDEAPPDAIVPPQEVEVD